MDELIESSYLQQSSWKRPHLQTVPLLAFLLCIVTTTWGDEFNNVGGDKELVDKMVNEDMAEDVVKLLGTDNKSSQEDAPCWKTESFTTQGPCQACDTIAMQYATYCCGETGFRQLVQCQASNFRIYKSCPKSKGAVEKSFWIFEGITLAIWMVSFLVVSLRRRALDWEALQRVRKQIANSA